MKDQYSTLNAAIESASNYDQLIAAVNGTSLYGDAYNMGHKGIEFGHAKNRIQNKYRNGLAVPKQDLFELQWRLHRIEKNLGFAKDDPAPVTAKPAKKEAKKQAPAKKAAAKKAENKNAGKGKDQTAKTAKTATTKTAAKAADAPKAEGGKEADKGDGKTDPASTK